jgi:hypothetical protein
MRLKKQLSAKCANSVLQVERNRIYLLHKLKPPFLEKGGFNCIDVILKKKSNFVWGSGTGEIFYRYSKHG